jgi:hypothetical protein
MSSSDLQNLFEIPKMNDELGLLKDEIEMFEQSGSKDPKLKADIDFKKKKAKALDDYLNKFIKYNNYYQRGQYKGPARKVLAEELGIDESEVTDKQIDERLNQEIGEMTDDRSIAIDSELETSYKEYLKTIADFNDTQLFTRDIDKAFIKLKDYYNLKRESRELAKHINIFSDPQGYFNMVKRNTEWMSNVYNNRKKYFDEMVDAQLKAKEHNDLLNALANQNIYVDLEEFQNFIDKFTITNMKMFPENEKIYYPVLKQVKCNFTGVKFRILKRCRDISKMTSDKFTNLLFFEMEDGQLDTKNNEYLNNTYENLFEDNDNYDKSDEENDDDDDE